MKIFRKIRVHFIRKELLWKQNYVEKRIKEVEQQIAQCEDPQQVLLLKKKIKNANIYLQGVKFVLFASEQPQEANKIVYKKIK